MEGSDLQPYLQRKPLLQCRLSGGRTCLTLQINGSNTSNNKENNAGLGGAGDGKKTEYCAGCWGSGRSVSKLQPLEISKTVWTRNMPVHIIRQTEMCKIDRYHILNTSDCYGWWHHKCLEWVNACTLGVNMDKCTAVSTG